MQSFPGWDLKFGRIISLDRRIPYSPIASGENSFAIKLKGLDHPKSRLDIQGIPKSQTLPLIRETRRYNLASMASFAENDLLSHFTTLTGMHPDCPIPAYIRLDANLFFTNFIAFRGVWPLAAGPAPASEKSSTLASEKSSSLAGQPPSTTTAPEPASSTGSQLVSPPLQFMKVRPIEKKPKNPQIE
jgi:hypothetical protein